MSSFALFYNSVAGDRKYDADSFSEWLAQFFSNGVLADGLEVTANNNMTVTVSAGTALINGKTKVFLEETTLSISTADGSNDRIDSIVVRRDDTARDFEIAVKTGAAASSPSAPALTRTGTVYEIKLADVRISKGTVAITSSNITDTRENTEGCGLITCKTETVPTEITQAIQNLQTQINQAKTLLNESIDQGDKSLAKQIAQAKTTLNKAIEEVNTKVTNLHAGIKRKRINLGVYKIEPGSDAINTDSYSWPGGTIGIVGIYITNGDSGSGSSKCIVSQFRMRGDNGIYVKVRNLSTTVTATVTVYADVISVVENI